MTTSVVCVPPWHGVDVIEPVAGLAGPLDVHIDLFPIGVRGSR